MITKRHKRLRFLSILLDFVFVFSLISCTDNYPKPKIDDVYIVKLDSLSYTTWKLTKIKSKNIWYQPNDYQVSDLLFIDSINSPQNYTDLPIKIQLKKFKTSQLKLLSPKNH